MNADLITVVCVLLGLGGLVGGLVSCHRRGDEVDDEDLEEVDDADLEEVDDADLEEVDDDAVKLRLVRAPPMPSAASIMALRHRLAHSRRNRFTINGDDPHGDVEEFDPEICPRCLNVNPGTTYVAGTPIQVLGCDACMQDPRPRRPARHAQPQVEVRHE